MTERFLTYDVECKECSKSISSNETVMRAITMGDDWHVPSIADIFEILDHDCASKFIEHTKHRSFWVRQGLSFKIMQFFNSDYPTISTLADRADVLLLIRDNMFDHLRQDMIVYETYANGKIMDILKNLGCVGNVYLNLDEYRGERGNDKRPFVDIPDGIIQDPDDDMDDNSFVGVRLIQPVDEYETDFIIEFDTANGRLYNLSEFGITDIYTLLYTLQSIFKLIRGKEISLFTYPAPGHEVSEPERKYTKKEILEIYGEDFLNNLLSIKAKPTCRPISPVQETEHMGKSEFMAELKADNNSVVQAYYFASYTGRLRTPEYYAIVKF